MIMLRRVNAALAVLLLAAPAAAQDALGDGHALDANTQVGSEGWNPRTFGPDFAARNALITRNVVAGRGFSDTVGYTAADDFRGELGSDDLFDFRADSALSNPLLFSAGRTYERLRFGQELGLLQYERAGRGATPATIGYDVTHPGAYDRDRLVLDQQAMEVSDDLVYRSAVEPEFVGAYTDAEGTPLVASASSLRGLVIGPLTGQPQMMGLTPYDSARVREDSLKGGAGVVGEPFAADFQDLLAPERAGDVADAGRVEGTTVSSRIDPAYRDVMTEIADRYAATDQEAQADQTMLVERLDAMLARIREELVAQAPEEGQPAGEGLDLGEAGAILRHGGVIDRLSVPDDPQRVEELMLQAAQMLKSGEYFWAERRFARALRFSPGHPVAMAGMANAQIGAGLYVPAALTLRNLFTEHPEMIDTRYGPDLLPNRVRLEIAIRKIDSDLERIRRDQALNGFVLAYLGHQMGDDTLLRRGLETVQEHAPKDRLLPLLRAVWLDDVN